MLGSIVVLHLKHHRVTNITAQIKCSLHFKQLIFYGKEETWNLKGVQEEVQGCKAGAKHSSVLFFTETWLHEDTPDSDVSVDVL